MKKLTTLIALAAIVGSASAAFIINDEAPHYIDFETDIATVFVANAGDNAYQRNIMEPDNGELVGDNRGPGVLSTSWASSHIWHNDGFGAGAPNHFLADGNNNATTTDVLGSNQMGMHNGSGAAGNQAYRIALDNSWADTALYLRIQNNTGHAVSDWGFTMDVFFGELVAADQSTLQYSIAVDNGTDAGAMTFTDFGSSLSSVNGDVITSLAGTMEANVTPSTAVADGDYLVLKINHANTGGGASTAFLDNIGVHAGGVVPEPATFGLVAVFGGTVLFIRRRLMM